MSISLKNLSHSGVSLVALLALSACGGGGGGNSGGTVTPPPPVVDTTSPVLSFSPDAITVQSGQTGSSTLSASDNIAITSGPTVSCTGGGSFSDNVFTPPAVTSNTTIFCEATASDAAGNTGTATLTVTVTPATPPVSNFFQNISQTITSDPVMGIHEIPTGTNRLIGLTKNTTGSQVIAFAATPGSTGVFTDIQGTSQSTLGTVGVAPLTIFSAELSGLDDDTKDLVFVDVTNEELVGARLNSNNIYTVPTTKSVPNICDADSGAGTRIIIPGGTNRVRRDMLVGTTNGLFYMSAGFADDGITTSGFGDPVMLVPTGDFCNLTASSSFPGTTIYATYDPTTRLIRGFEGERGDASSYTEEFSVDLSNEVGINETPLLFDGTFDTFSFMTAVFDDPNGGSIVVIADVGSTPEIKTVKIDMEGPTDMLIFNNSLSDDIILVSPTSENAVFIRETQLDTPIVEFIEIGLDFDQVDRGAGAAVFASSIVGNLVVRTP